ncbi:MAG: bifunctional heptose 7-phosphate kinase/heptose 1-phosphate adenyltransferase, partial [Firmicutes bacterium]|nr:bifunctional heptose 7-phosphate kinase/heptose 1-phosphate adenyltransferase [Bacillota bacterium]
MDSSIKEILNAIGNISNKHVVVIGDILLDEYIYGTVNKISTGIQIPIIDKESVEYRLGGAANVAANVAGLCNYTTLIGRCANDDAGNRVNELCESYHVNLVGFDSDRTVIKQRIYVDNQQVSRLDTNSFSESIDKELSTILASNEVDVVIIADYLYGVVSQEVLDITTNYCKGKAIPIFYSSRDLGRFNIGEYPVAVVNQKEWKQWNQSNECKKAFITKGNTGICYISETLEVEKKANKKYPVNVSGAGDTVLAIISLLYEEKTISIDDVLLVANLAGTLAVENELTYVVRQYDLVDALYKQWINDDSINKIVDVSLAQNIVSAWKQKGEIIVFTNGCYDLLHLGHIKSFQYSKKYGDKLVVAVNSDSSIKRLKGKGRPINNLDERVSILAYLSMIDMVIPFEEDTAINVIKAIEPDTYI